MFSSLKQRSAGPARRQAYGTYAQLVQKARDPFCYTECGVPDTIDGRFELILLQLFLLSQRLKAEPKEVEIMKFSRYITEAFFEDMDRSLREIGISDTGVPRRVKAMARAHFGRLKHYEESFADNSRLIQTLRRNVYATVAPPAAEKVQNLAEYLYKTALTLQKTPLDSLQNGEF